MEPKEPPKKYTTSHQKLSINDNLFSNLESIKVGNIPLLYREMDLIKDKDTRQLALILINTQVMLMDYLALISYKFNKDEKIENEMGKGEPNESQLN